MVIDDGVVMRNEMNVKPECRLIAKPESVLIMKPESVRLWLVGPLPRMLMFVKPESRLIFSVVRVVALSVPSGVGLCTSEQTDPQCGACTANLPALRFCGSSPLLVGVRAEFFRR